MGVKVYGPDLETIEQAAIRIEAELRQVPSVRPETVIADRTAGKPYLEIRIDREAIARYGLSIAMVQDVIEVAIGGRPLTTTVEGRERYPVRVRYQRERRDSLEDLGRVLVPTPGGAQIPLLQLAEIAYVRGPMEIKSEDTFLVAYVTFDKLPAVAEVDAVQEAQRHLQARIRSGELVLPAGVSYRFAGSYENQVRSEATLRVVLPAALLLIFLILYLQFRSVPVTGMVFSGILVAWSGGFLLIWFYNQPWFLDLEVLGTSLRQLLQIQPINLSVAVWVGFIALFGIATDDGVVMATYLGQSFARRRPDSPDAIRRAVLEGAGRRVRPAMMTTATTILALLPVLTSTGRGSDIIVPMAIPTFGGMLLAVLTVFTVPILYSAWQEQRWRRTARREAPPTSPPL
jgi:copper/silver efflux system protein